MGVRITEYNIERDKAKNAEMRQKSGQGGVPVVDVEGIIIRGYNPEAIYDAVAKKKAQGN